MWIYEVTAIYTVSVSKHLVDLDDDLLATARAELGTASIKETVNEALRRASGTRSVTVQQAFDVLACAQLEDREHAWR